MRLLDHTTAMWLQRVSISVAGALTVYVVARRVRAVLLGKAKSAVESSGGDIKQLAQAHETQELQRTLTAEEVQRHCTTDDCWIIIDDVVYDVTEFALSHPGGPELVYQCAGRDATIDFLSVHPPEYAWEYVGPAIGVIETTVPKELPPAGLPSLEEGESFRKLRQALRDGVLTVTGGFGAMVQRYMREQAALSESDYRSCPDLENHPQDLLGNHDVLALTRPDVVKWVYRRSMEGCNIVGTSTFNTQAISQEEYGIHGNLIYKMAKQSAELAKAVREELEATAGLCARFVGGQIGPTTKTACVAIDVTDPSVRNTDFDELSAAYGELVAGMVDGGVDLVMVDCAFDTLNVKAALYAMEKVMIERGRRLPVMVSMSLVDDSGRTLSGQTVEAFWASIRHARPFTVGFNCGAGPKQMWPYLTRLSSMAECFVHAYPNAGLPNAEGCYDLEPEPMAAEVQGFARARLSNVVGGCCGAGPHHLRAITDKVQCLRSGEGGRQTALRIPSDTNNGGHFDRALYPTGVSIPSRRPRFLLSGTEQLAWRADSLECGLVVQVQLSDLQGPDWRAYGEKEALRRLRAAARDEAVQVLGVQFAMHRRGSTGAWSDQDVVRLANLVQGEPDLSTKPLLIRVEPLDAAGQATLVKVLKCLQGRSLVDMGSVLSPDPGAGGVGHIGEGFVKVLSEVRSLGNSVLVDAATSDLRQSLRGFELLGFEKDEVVLAVPHGSILSSDDAARGVVSAIRLVDHRAVPPPPQGESAVAWAAALSRAHVGRNAGGAAMVIAPSCEVDLSAALVSQAEQEVAQLYASTEKASASRSEGREARTEAQPGAATEPEAPAVDDGSLGLQRCVQEGVDAGLMEAVQAAMATGHTVDSIINGPLMEAMRRVSDSYSSGGSSLPQVLKSSRVLKVAVNALQALSTSDHDSKAASTSSDVVVREKVVLATVKGDVHDLGKTIVGILLKCNGYHVVDLGRNIELDAIADEALGGADGQKAAMVGMSGMISPSLGRMVEAVNIFRDRGLSCPVLVGGSATSSAFCALFLDTLGYQGGVFRIADGPRTIMAASALLRSPEEERSEWMRDQQDKYQELREERRSLTESSHKLLPLAEARKKASSLRPERFPQGWQPYKPSGPVSSVVVETFSLAQVLPLVNWTYFFQVFNLQGRHPHHTWPSLLQDPDTGAQARSLQADLDRLVGLIPSDAPVVQCVHALLPARAVGDDIHVQKPDGGGACAAIPLLRQQTRDCLSLADFISEDDGDHLAVFACACHVGERGLDGVTLHDAEDEYQQVLLKALAARLVEAGAELLHHQMRRRWYEGVEKELSAAELLQEKYAGIRPAVGYPSIPDQRVMGVLWELLGMEERKAETGMWVTDSFGLSPEASIAGVALSHPLSSYFSIGRASQEQVADYAVRARALPSGPALSAPSAQTEAVERSMDRPASEDVAETQKWLTAVLS